VCGSGSVEEGEYKLRVEACLVRESREAIQSGDTLELAPDLLLHRHTDTTT
jgi:hypothetical protein